MSQNIAVNLHRPQIEDVKVQSSGTIVVGLGNGVYHGGVDVFFEDVAAVQEFIRSLALKVAELEAVSV